MKVSPTVIGLLSFVVVSQATISRVNRAAEHSLESEWNQEDLGQIPFGDHDTPHTRQRHDILLQEVEQAVTIGTISIGTPPQTFRVQLDLNSPRLSIPLNTCEFCGSSEKPFKNDQSSTYEAIKTSFESGRPLPRVISEDVVHLTEDLILPQQPFDNRNPSGYFTEVYGTIGLSYNHQESGPTPVLTRLKELGLLDENVLGLYVGYLNDKTSSDQGFSGELTIGGLNPNRYRGGHELHWHSTVHPGRWAIGLDKIILDWEFQKRKDRSDEEAIEIESDYMLRTADDNHNAPRSRRIIRMDQRLNNGELAKPIPAYLKPDSLYTSLPSRAARELNEALNFTAFSETGYGVLGCREKLDWEELPYLGYSIGGSIYWFEPHEYLIRNARHLPDKCHSLIDGEASQGLEGKSDEGAVLGTTFMGKFFTAFDFENHQVGFALAAEPDE
ncbi:hypothetical protein EMPS_02775 [Entomortierella parvispora]|uniref:Peptidase A1 domain-containing protein n=1 Tax=Entomortierella parvispora TaxID=205924 RepID=A0A9P3H5E1_9FUNG|nr:hypothetical protein EMPS_02775 [Entomortierella parvispora]